MASVSLGEIGLFLSLGLALIVVTLGVVTVVEGVVKKSRERRGRQLAFELAQVSVAAGFDKLVVERYSEHGTAGVEVLGKLLRYLDGLPVPSSSRIVREVNRTTKFGSYWETMDGLDIDQVLSRLLDVGAAKLENGVVRYADWTMSRLIAWQERLGLTSAQDAGRVKLEILLR